MCMSETSILCVTHRHLCVEDFNVRMQKIVHLRPFAVVLREKDLVEEEYEILLNTIIPLCKDVPLFVHRYIDLAIKNSLGVQISFQQYQEMDEISTPLGISIHSIEEAQYIAHDVRSLNISHVVAGHIFNTDCKKGLPPRGLKFLSHVCEILNPLSIPVYGIGGITPTRMPDIMGTGANGAALMSSLMNCKDPRELFDEFSSLHLSQSF